MNPSNQEKDLHLLHRIRAEEDGKAKEELIRKYLPMVKRIVKSQNFYKTEYEDLLQEGLIGLLRAVNEYDYNYQIKFSTFAYICIVRKIYNTLKHFSSKKNRFYYEAASIFNYINPEESRTIMDTVDDSSFDPERVVQEKLNNLRLREVLKAYLSQVEYSVLILYLQGLSCGEIQQRLNLEAKVIDNAKTRARLKLQRIIKEYGSLLSPMVPLNTRKRLDLSMKLKVI